MNENYEILKIQPTTSVSTVKEAFHKQLRKNFNKMSEIQSIVDAYKNITNLLDNGYYQGEYGIQSLKDGLLCKCGAKFECEMGVVECDSCSCFIIVKEKCLWLYFFGFF